MKRVLIVAYYFPPSGGPGVQRVLKAVKYLREFGYEPTILTVDNGAFPQFDEELALEIPSGVQVVRTKSFSPFGAYAKLTGKSKKDAVVVGTVKQRGGMMERLASWIRANVFLPDARVGWVPYAIRKAIELYDKDQFDVVLTSGPPHSCHLIGRYLKRKLQLPWVADFRDPWTDINYYHELPMSGWARRKDGKMETQVLTEADNVTTVSPSWATLLKSKGANRVAVVQNGFDETDFHNVVGRPSDDTFVISHVGSLYPSRNPNAFWQALAELRKEGKLTHARVRIAGSVSNEVIESIEECGLQSITEVIPYRSHREAIQLMLDSHVLLLSIERFEQANGMITGKLYEYIRSGRPILGLGPASGDAANLLLETKSGQLFDRDDNGGICGYLLDQYAAWESGSVVAKSTGGSIQSLSRRTQTGLLAGVMDEVLGV